MRNDYPQPMAPVVPPRDQTLLEEHVNVLYKQCGDLSSALNRLQGVTDRLLGPVPVKAEPAAPPIPELPLLEKVGRCGREFTSVIADLHELITRLERV